MQLEIKVIFPFLVLFYGLKEKDYKDFTFSARKQYVNTAIELKYINHHLNGVKHYYYYMYYKCTSLTYCNFIQDQRHRKSLNNSYLFNCCPILNNITIF